MRGSKARCANAPLTRTTGGPSPRRSNAIRVPSAETTGPRKVSSPSISVNAVERRAARAAGDLEHARGRAEPQLRAEAVELLARQPAGRADVLAPRRAADGGVERSVAKPP